MTIFNYIDNYGIYDFNEKPFNEVDATIFSFLSYINFDGLISKEKVRLNTLSRQCFSQYKSSNKRNIIAEKDALKIFNYIRDTKRYRDCYLFNYVYEVDSESQFCAVTIEYKKNHIYVSYEGTDQMISGWHENFLLGYSYPTKAHSKAISYLNTNYTFTGYHIIIGGHSKGGNLALVAGANANFIIRSRITKIYNMDGPGLLPSIINNKKYNNIKSKYIHIIPDSSIVGILLDNFNDQVIKSNIDGILSHDIVYWDITDNQLTKNKLSLFSNQLKIRINKYVYSLSKEELSALVNNFDIVCSNANVKSIIEIYEDNRKILKLFNEANKMDKDVKKLLFGFIEIIIKSLGDTASYKLQELLNKIKELRQ